MPTARRIDEEMISSRRVEAVRSVAIRLAKIKWIRSHCPIEWFEDLAADKDWLVRSEIAMLDICPPKAQLRLANDPNPIVRACLVKNKNATQDILDFLNKDETEMVRLAFEERRHPNLSR